MRSAVIGLTSYRCGVDGAHGGADEETWLYRLLHTGDTNDGWAVDPRVSDSAVRFSFSRSDSPSIPRPYPYLLFLFSSRKFDLSIRRTSSSAARTRGSELPCSHNS